MPTPYSLLSEAVETQVQQRRAPSIFFPGLESVEVIVPVGALLRQLPEDLLSSEDDIPGAFSCYVATQLEEGLTRIGRFLGTGDWFASVAICRQLLEFVIVMQEGVEATRAWREGGAIGPPPSLPTRLWDAERAAALTPRLADLVEAYQLTSEATHGRGGLTALWTTDVHSRYWHQALAQFNQALGLISDVAIGSAQLAHKLSSASSNVPEYVRQRGRGPRWHYHPDHDLVCTAFDVLWGDDTTERLAAALPDFTRDEEDYYAVAARGATDVAGTTEAVLLRLMRHGAYRADRFMQSKRSHAAAGIEMSDLIVETASALRCAFLAQQLATRLLTGPHGAALATAGAALHASTLLWADDNDYLFTAAHRTVEQTARARQWREDPVRAETTEGRHRGTQRWVQRRYAAFERLLVDMDAFVHAYLAERRPASRQRLVASFGRRPTNPNSPTGGPGNEGRTDCQRLAHLVLAQELFATLATAYPGYDTKATTEAIGLSSEQIDSGLTVLRNDVGRFRRLLQPG